MDGPIDCKRAADSLFDTANSEIIAQLEDGEKEISTLASKSGLSGDEILSNLSYLIETEIITKSVRGDGSVYLSADHEKLSEIIESDGSLGGAAMDGLAKMDGYLN